MPTYNSNRAGDDTPAVEGNSSDALVAIRGEVDFADLPALVANDILAMVKIPPRHVVVDADVDCDDLDSGGAPALVFDAGIIGGDTNAFLAASTLGQAGGFARMDQVAGKRVAASNAETVAGITVTTIPATQPATGKIGMTVYYKPV